MRPLPRVLAYTDRSVLEDPNFGIAAAAIASAGSSIAIVVRAPELDAADRLRFTDRARSLVRPAEASVFAHGDAAVAAATGAQGLQLRTSDLEVGDARRVFPRGWLGVSVHTEEQAERAAAEGADYLVAGNLFETSTHPGRPGLGLEWLGRILSLGKPVIGIGGIDPTRARAARAAGAYGVATITALWRNPDPARAAEALVEACEP